MEPIVLGIRDPRSGDSNVGMLLFVSRDNYVIRIEEVIMLYEPWDFRIDLQFPILPNNGRWMANHQFSIIYLISSTSYASSAAK